MEKYRIEIFDDLLSTVLLLQVKKWWGWVTFKKVVIPFKNQDKGKHYKDIMNEKNKLYEIINNLEK